MFASCEKFLPLSAYAFLIMALYIDIR